MPDERSAAPAASWSDVLPIGLFLQAARLAFNFRALTFAALALAATSAGWRLIGSAFDNSRGTVIEEYNRWPWDASLRTLDLENPVHAAELPTRSIPDRGPITRPTDMPSDSRLLDWAATSPILHTWKYITDPFVRLFSRRVSLDQFGYLLLCGLWALTVWALFGGAITRLAAVALARDEQLSWGQALGYARRKWLAYLLAPIIPLLGVTIVALPLALGGLLLRSDVGVVIAGILWPLVLLAGFLMAIMVLGLLFGWPLMWATISAEGTESFDALSRSYAYVFQRPIVYLFYLFVAALLGTVAWLLVSLFANEVLNLGNWGVSWGSGEERLRDVLAKRGLDDTADAGATIIRFWSGCAITLALAYFFSYFWTASQAIYFLLRREIDATELDAVYLPEEEEAFGLPPLATDEAGVATVPPAASSDVDRPTGL